MASPHHRRNHVCVPTTFTTTTPPRCYYSHCSTQPHHHPISPTKLSIIHFSNPLFISSSNSNSCNTTSLVSSLLAFQTEQEKKRSHLSLLDSGLTPPESYQANCKFRSWLFETQSKSWINHLNGPGFTTTLTISATPYPKETRWTRPLWIHFHCSDNKNV